MRLHEEYISRHALDVPVVRYDKRSTVFLKDKIEPPEWRIMSIQWNECDWHPGEFVIRQTRPRHDGYTRSLIEDVIRPVQVHWDEYEEYILNFVSEYKSFEPIPQEECNVEAWKMFLYMYDSSLARLGTSFLTLVGKSLDPDITLVQKAEFINAGKAQLKICDYDVYESLMHQVFPLASNYAEWLVNLFND